MRRVLPLVLLTVSVAVTGCDDAPPGAARDAATDADASSPSRGFCGSFPDGGCCPERWVPYARGGCGPAALLCAPGGGAAAGACDGVDWMTPQTVVDSDGTEGVALHRLPDGGLGGAWSARPRACPDGWVRDEGACRPTLRADCEDGSIPLPDGSCTLTGESTCAAAPFADVTAEAGASRVVYVAADAAPGGDGTRAAPFADIHAGIAAAGEGGWVLVAEGHYRGPFYLTGARTIVGRCPTRVRLEGGGDPSSPVLHVHGPHGRLHLRGVTVGSNRTGGGIVMTQGATLDGERVVVRAVAESAIEVSGGSTLNLTDVSVSEVSEVGAPRDAGGIWLTDGPNRATLRRVGLRGTDRHGIVVQGAGASLRLDRVSVQQTEYDGVQVDRAELEADQVVVAGGAFSGVRVLGARATLRDVAVRAVRPYVIGGGAVGIDVGDGATLRLQGGLIEDVPVVGVHATGRSTRLDIEDLSVRRITVGAEGYGGNALSVDDNAAVRGRRLQLTDTRDAAVLVNTWGGVDLRDSVIRRVVPSPRGYAGFGIVQGLFGHSRVERVVVEGSSMASFFAIGIPRALIVRLGFDRYLEPGTDLTTSLELHDVIARGGVPPPRAPAMGIGAGAILRGERVAVEASYGAAVMATQQGTPSSLLVNGLVRSGRVPPSLGPVLERILGPSLDGSATLDLVDVFVRDLSHWNVSVDPDTQDRPTSGLVAYGLYAGFGCDLTARRCAVDGGGTADYPAVTFGAMRLFDGVLTGGARCAATRSDTATGARIDLDAVERRGNVNDGVCVDSALSAIRLPLGAD